MVMMRSKPASSMQKTYDECYLICSTAVYFEGQNNEAEALRSWRSALDQIYYHNAYKLPTNYVPKSETEKALLDSLKQLEIQCKERVDLLDALRRSRKEQARADRETAKEARKLDKGKDQAADNSPPAETAGEGPLSPTQLPDLSKPPALPSRPSFISKASSESMNQRSNNTPQSYTSLAPPMLPVPRKPISRTPSPDAKHKKAMRTTLRTSAGKSTRPWTTRVPTQGRAPLKAAGMAWDTNARTFSPPTVHGFQKQAPHASSIRPRLEATATRKSFDQLGAHASEEGLKRRNAVRPSESGDFIPSSNWREIPGPQSPPRREVVGSLGLDPGKQSAAESPRIDDTPLSPLHDSTGKNLQHGPTMYMPPQLSKAPELSYRKEFPPSTLKSIPRSTANAIASNALHKPSETTEASQPSRPPAINLSTPGIDTASHSQSPKQVSSESDETLTARPKATINTGHRRPINQAGGQVRRSPTPSPSSEATSEEREDSSESDAFEQRKAALISDLPKNVDLATATQILNEIIVHGDEVHWSDVAGLEVAKKALKEAVVYPFLRPDLFMGLREPARGMLLFGPPGTGKTMLARAVATESKSTFFAISAGSLTSKWHGESEKLVRALFSVAKRLAPSIIFVDEIDSLLGSRGGASGGGEHEASRRSKTEFLIQWSDLQKAAAGSNHGSKGGDGGQGDPTRVLVLAATNMPWDIDEAARRRFVRRQYIPLPEAETREVQVRTLLGHQKHELSDADIEVLVQVTSGFSGSDITALAKDAAMGPLRNLGEALLYTPREEIRAITFQDFEASLENIRPSVSKAGLREYEDWAREFGERGG